jgi:hypothetical protein
VSAPATLCRELRRLRNHGLDFDAAWPQALEIALSVDCSPGAWLAVLTSTRSGWEAAYNREPSRRHENAVVMVATDNDGGARELEDPEDRACPQCGLQVKRPNGNARYCSYRCKRLANRRGAVVELVA